MSPVSLPIEAILPELKAALRQRDEAVLEAPPGAGKTTLTPLALLHEPWLGTQKIILLEPRRLAARAAAERMAALLGEPVGQTVGYRVRLDSKVSAATRIEVVTEGVLTRWLQDDPSLDGVGLVIFDEFHERSLEADLGLALALQGRSLLREDPPLKLLVMSATLDGVNVARLLAEAPIIRSEGRSYPVEIRYADPWRAGDALEARVVTTVRQALADEDGSLLVFLPGQGEIRRVHQRLQDELRDQPEILLAPLYGDLTLDEQRRAIEPAPAGRRKIVLATAIAESSLTIDGVRVVVDAGLSRSASFDPRTGMTRLQTRRLSRAASIQRMGRAGRLQPGVCYRLWSEDQQAQLSPFSDPEILQADLAPLALQLQRWGVDDPNELAWLDPPPAAPYAQALELLAELGALRRREGGGWQLTPHGEAMASLPAHPRLAHLLLMGCRYGLSRLACELATLLSERDPLPEAEADIGLRLAWLRGTLPSARRNEGVRQRMRQQCRQFQRLCEGLTVSQAREALLAASEEARGIGFLLACAYPDRIAQRRSEGGCDYRLSNGRAARLPEADPLQRAPWLAVAQLGGRQGDATDRIFMAAELDPALFNGPLAELLDERETVYWDRQQARLRAECQQRVGALVLTRQEQPRPSEQARRAVLLDVVRKQGMQLLPWTDELRQWQARVLFLRQQELAAQGESEWPDVSDERLLATLDEWLAPYLDEVSHISHFAALDLRAMLHALLPWPLPQKLEQLAPEQYQVPSGSRIRIDYRETPPVLAVRLQEMFGCAETPRIGHGVALKLHLLSPAQRPLQVTQDLAGFWRTSYAEVKKEMKGRYPKHHWPDDPLAAQATRGAKRRPREG